MQPKHNYLQHNNNNMSLFERLTSLFAPDECLSCHREGVLLCGDCTAALVRTQGVCFACYARTKGVVCPDCLPQTECASLRGFTDYSGVAKQLVASLKFMGNQSAARIMAGRMANLCDALPAGTLVTHVPATTQHIRERGYDQAALLARHIARLFGAEHAATLARVGRKHQLGSGREERLHQMIAALRVRSPAKVHGRSVLLVDDVLTTGASIRVATKCLLRAGASRVDGLVFAQSVKINKTS